MSGEGSLRIAIVSEERCKPKRCKQECLKSCPVVRMGKLCIEVTAASRVAWISEELCIGCGICVKKCPFEAINIINLPRSLASETTHRYGPNSFKLHRLPTPRPCEVLGLVGTNGIGKSTALKVLAGKLKPNLGRYDAPPNWDEVLRHFRGSELQNYFGRVLEENIKALIKPQYVDHLPKAIKGTVGPLLRAKDERRVVDKILVDLQLEHLVGRDIDQLSGGELQRFAIAMVAVQNADVYMFDEPSSYLDVRQRLKAAQVIRSLTGKSEEAMAAQAAIARMDAERANAEGEAEERAAELAAAAEAEGAAEAGAASPAASTRSAASSVVGMKGAVVRSAAGGQGAGAAAAALAAADTKYVICVEHDLAVLDYLSDYICCLYGQPGAYGVVTMPFSVREGINVFLAGFVPTENLRFREESLTFKVATGFEEEMAKPTSRYKYPAMVKRLNGGPAGGDPFQLKVEAGEFSDSQIVVMLGENGTGKTTFIRMLAGLLAPDKVAEGEDQPEIKGFSVSYKPQKISPTFEGSVRALFYAKIKEAYLHPQFISDVIKPLNIENIVDQEVKNLSGGELQRVALCLCLGKPADVYLIDEPSAYLDSEQRIIASKIIKRFILHAKKTAFIVEHDFIMATYLADRVIVYEGSPGVKCTANAPQSLLSGMNAFLKTLDITFRRDPTNFRPRINKHNSQQDQVQKKAGTYFYIDSSDGSGSHQK
jgi:translation initiation factor RLI1